CPVTSAPRTSPPFPNLSQRKRNGKRSSDHQVGMRLALELSSFAAGPRPRLDRTDCNLTNMRPKILLVDDDKDLLDLYQEMLSQLPSKPEIATSTSGARALAMLDNEPCSVLVCDLNMPKMDGLQVLSIVRRKFPE